MAENNKKQEISAADAAALKENEKVTGRLPKILLWTCVAVIIIVAAVLCYIYFIRKPGQEKAMEAASKVDIELLDKHSGDSIVAALASEAATKGYDEGNRMHLVAAISYYNDGKYEDCVRQLDEFDAKDAIIGAAAYSLKGDAYVNMDKYDDAAKAFNDAISQSDRNPAYTPIFMQKLARVLDAQQKYDEELNILRQIKSDYPQYADTNGIAAQIARLENR